MRPVPGFGPEQMRLPRQGLPPTVGQTPRPSPAVNADYGRFVKQVVVPEATFDIIIGRTQLMILKDAPRRIQIADESIAAYTLITPTEISILGKDVGSTVLNLWFTDPAQIWDALSERRMVDDLTVQLALPITELTRQLMTLELKKVVRRLPGNWYERF